MKNKKILIVDDMPEWLNHHRQILFSTLGFNEENIDVKMSAKSAFAQIQSTEKNYYDLIITDMQMEYISDSKFAGEWLLENATNHPNCEKTKFLIISSAYNIEKIAKNHNVDYIRKAFLIKNPMILKYKTEELLKL